MTATNDCGELNADNLRLAANHLRALGRHHHL